MKTFLKIFICICIVLTLSIVGFYFYAMQESVQRDFAQKMLAKHFEVVKFEGLKANLNSLKIEDIELDNDEVSFQAREIYIEYSSLLSLFSDALNIGQAKINAAKLNIKGDAQAVHSQTGSTLATSNGLFAQEYAQNNPQKSTQAMQKSQAIVMHNQEVADKKLSLNIDSLQGDLKIETAGEAFANIDILAQDIKLKELNDLRGIKLRATINNSFLKDNTRLELQVKELNEKRNLQAQLSNGENTLAKTIATYSSNFESANITLISNIDEKSLSEKLQNKVGTSFNVEFYAETKFDNFFKDLTATIKANANAGQLKFEQEELNLLSNSKINIATQIKKTAKSLSISTLEGELYHDGKVLAQLKLDKSISSDGQKILDIESLNNFATLYIDNIPSAVLRNYLPNYDFSDNKINAYLSLSLDPENNAIRIESKEEIYFKAEEVLKDEAIVASKIFLGLNFSAMLDLESNIKANTQIRIIEKGEKELKANIEFDKSIDGISASIDAFGDAVVIFNNAKAHVDNVEKIRNSQIKLQANLLQKDEILEISQLKAKLFEGEYQLFEVELSDNLLFKNLELQNESLKAKLLAKTLPFAPFKELCPEIDATSLSCDIDIEKKGDNIMAAGTASLENLSYIGLAGLENLNPSITFSLDFKEEGILADIKSLRLSYKDTEVARAKSILKLSSEGEILDSKSEIALYLASLVNIPALSKLSNIQSGYGELSIDYNPDIIKADANITNLKLYSAKDSISSIKINSISQISKAVKTVNFHLGIASPNGQSNFATNLNIDDTDIKIKLDSAKMHIDDIAFFFKLTDKVEPTATGYKGYKKPEKLSFEERKARAMQAAKVVKYEHLEKQAKKTPKVRANIPVPTKAIWDYGYNVELIANFDSIEKNQDEIIKNLSAKINVDKSFVKSDYIKFKSNKAKRGTAEIFLDFDNTAKRAYQLKNLDLNLSDIDTSKLSKNSTMEGLLDFDLKLHSSANDIDTLFENIEGTASLVNNGLGKIRFVEANSTIGAASNIAGSLIGIAEGFLGGKVKELSAVNRLMDIFKEYNYRTLKAEIKRDALLDINIENIKIDGDDIFIIGAGTISYDESKSILDQNMNIALISYVKDTELASLFAKLNLMRETSNIENYYQGPTFSIYGSLNNPRNNVQEILGNSTANTANTILEKFIK